jgi:hypothetical protein
MHSAGQIELRSKSELQFSSMNFFSHTTLKSAVLTFAATASAVLSAQPGHSKVIELLLSIDVSGSVDDSEYDLMRQGYFNAFSDPAIRTNILSQAGFAVAVQQWDSSPYPVSIDWIDLTQGSNYDTFLTALNGMSRLGFGSTSPASAITSGITLITGNVFSGDVKIIDVSGDGEENNLPFSAVSAARDSAFSSGIIINGLPINDGGTIVEDFYRDYIVTSNGSLFPASSFADFNPAVKKKIEFESTGGGVPPGPPASSVPAPLPVLGVAAALGSVRKLKQFSTQLKTYSMG